MRERSTIGVILKKKKRASTAKRIGVWAVFIVFFISLAVLGLTAYQVRVHDVVITGNSAVHTADIAAVADTLLDKRYLGIVATDNILLLDRAGIKNTLLATFKNIHTVEISFSGLNTLHISVTERLMQSLWCAGMPDHPGACFFMDSDGFVFAKATSTAISIPRYFGLIASSSPIGESYASSSFFALLAKVFDTVRAMQFAPYAFSAQSIDEYEITLKGGGILYLNNGKPFSQSLMNLQALIDNGYIKTDDGFLKKIQYIDLRYGNKVDFKLIQ